MRCTGSPSRAMTTVTVSQRDQAAAEPVPDAVVEERPAHEGVAAADQLGDLDLVAPVLDVEADGVADDHQDAEREQSRREQHHAPHHVEDGVEAAHPRGVELHDVHAVDLAQLARAELSTGAGSRNSAAGRTTSACGSGLSLSASSASPKPESLAELGERVVGLDQRHVLDVAPLARCASSPAAPARASPRASCTRRCRARCPSRRSRRARSAPARAGTPAAPARCRSPAR